MIRAIHIYDAFSGQPLRAAIEPLENLDFFGFDSSGEYLLVETNPPEPMNSYEIWHTNMTEPLFINSPQKPMPPYVFSNATPHGNDVAKWQRLTKANSRRRASVLNPASK